MQSIVSLIALSMVPAVIWLAIDVVTHYWPKFGRPIKEWNAEHYLILGVMISFGGAGVLNGLHWGAHFLAHEMGWHSIEAWTYKYGQLVNIFTRNLTYMGAGLLHLAAAWIYKIPGVRSPAFYLCRTVIVTAIAFALLELMAG